MRKEIGKFFLGIGEKLALGYDSGETNRMRKDLGWGRQTARDEDSMISDGTLEKTRLKLTDLKRNSPVVAGVGDRIALWTVGDTGIRPQAHTSDSALNNDLEQWWNEIFSNNCDSRGRLTLRDMQWMAVSLRPIQGGMYFQKTDDFKIRPIECERIRQPTDAKKAEGYVEGFRCDKKTGQLVDVMVHSRDDYGTFSGKHTEEIIPIEQIIRCVRAPWRPDQVREIPDLAAIVNTLTDINEMNQYALNTAKVQSGVLGFLKKQGGGGGLNSAQRGSVQPVVGARQTFKYDWGMVLEGYPGDDLDMKSSPTPGTTHIPYVKLQYALCGAAVGFPYEFLTLDMSPLDYSRFKGLLLLVNYAARPWKRWLVDNFLRPLWNWRIAMEMRPGGTFGRVKFPVSANGVNEWHKVEWQGPEEPWLDRQEAQQSDVLEIQSNLGTYAAAIARRGGDPEQNLRSNARYLKMVQKVATEEGVTAEELHHMQIPGQTQNVASDKNKTNVADKNAGGITTNE